MLSVAAGIASARPGLFGGVAGAIEAHIAASHMAARKEALLAYWLEFALIGSESDGRRRLQGPTWCAPTCRRYPPDFLSSAAAPPLAALRD
jgi:hypothetical protein